MQSTQNVMHHSLIKEWSKNINIVNPKVLVLGSFNPFNPKGKNDVDYYYGRDSNHFWRSIGRVCRKDELYYLGNNNYQRKLEIMKEKFLCLDVIDSIEFTCDNEFILREFINKKIFSEFKDQTIWTTDTTFNRKKISGKIVYNNLVLDFLERSKSIMKVIHTMGANRVPVNKISRSMHSSKNGFIQYMQKVYSTCQKKGIEFVFDSYSPSGYAVKAGRTNIEVLDSWLGTNLNLKYLDND